VLGLVEETLDEDGSVTESSQSLRRRTLERGLERLRLTNDTHTTSSSAVLRKRKKKVQNHFKMERTGTGQTAALMITGKPCSWTNAFPSSKVSMAPGVPGTTGTLMEVAAKERVQHRCRGRRREQLTESPGLDLVSQSVNDLGLRTDEDDSGFLDLASELGVLGKEAVTGVDHGDAVLWERWSEGQNVSREGGKGTRKGESTSRAICSGMKGQSVRPPSGAGTEWS
jgi:hypothetical protein